MAPKTMKKKGFGHLKTRLFTIKTSKNIGFGGPMVNVYIYICIRNIIPPETNSLQLKIDA